MPVLGATSAYGSRSSSPDPALEDELVVASVSSPSPSPSTTDRVALDGIPGDINGVNVILSPVMTLKIRPPVGSGSRVAL